jgi:hypothetical protein
MADEQTVRVTRKQNALTVHAHGHTFLSLVGPHGEVVRERGGAERATFRAAAGTWTIQTDGVIDRAEPDRVEAPDDETAEAPAVLYLTSDAPDQHVVDGVGELPADGTSFCTITVEKHDVDGTPLRRRRDSDEVFLRTTGGLLEDARGRRVRSVRLREGRARVRLVSEAAPRLVTVEAIGHPPLAGATIRIEFV